jgi:putative transcriptional regulator
MRKMRKRGRASRTVTFLDGQLLIAMPTMTDRRFQRSVIYMCAHSREGAMGLIVNQRADHITFPKLLRQLDILPGDKDDRNLPAGLQGMAVHVGGPVETVRGFVLHTADYFASDSTLPIDQDVCLTATIDILKAVAGGKGPRQSILALGYSNWSPGQLEREIQGNGWLSCEADAELIFGSDLDAKYPRAMAKLGVDLTHFISNAGTA